METIYTLLAYNMNIMQDQILRDIEDKKDHIFNLSNLCGKHENRISSALFKLLDWKVENRQYNGFFGWKDFKTDKCLRTQDGVVIIEIKKVTEGTEYGYWHALVQALIYSAKEKTRSDGNILLLCIVLDWGRKAGMPLNDEEKEFLKQFSNHRICFVRISMANRNFIEHNLRGNWVLINSDDKS